MISENMNSVQIRYLYFIQKILCACNFSHTYHAVHVIKMIVLSRYDHTCSMYDILAQSKEGSPR